jgi:hypothetical protein
MGGGSASRKASACIQNDTNRINAHNTNIHALSGIRTHDPGVRTVEDSSRLRPRGHSGRPEPDITECKPNNSLTTFVLTSIKVIVCGATLLNNQPSILSKYDCLDAEESGVINWKAWWQRPDDHSNNDDQPHNIKNNYYYQLIITWYKTLCRSSLVFWWETGITDCRNKGEKNSPSSRFNNLLVLYIYIYIILSGWRLAWMQYCTPERIELFRFSSRFDLGFIQSPVTDLKLDVLCSIRGSCKIFLFSTASIPALGPPVLLFSGDSFLWGKAVELSSSPLASI